MTKDLIFRSGPIALGSIFDDLFDIMSRDLPLFHSYQIPSVFHLPNFPVTNSYMDEDGTTILEIAATGLGKEDVSIDIDGTLLIISGGKEKEEDSKKKVIYKKWSDKKFSLSYRCSSRQDLSQIKASIDKGLLLINIPLKEEEKPIKRKVIIE